MPYSERKGNKGGGGVDILLSQEDVYLRFY